MGHKHIIACLCYSLACMVSCQNESEELPFQTAELPMSVVAQIGETPAIQGRYAGTNPNDVAFADKDAIGIFVNEDAVVRWDYDGTSWTAEKAVYWADKENTHSFKAFYPYSAATSYNSIPMPGLQQQDGTMESIAQCDFLIATASQSYGESGTVTFTGEENSFRHVSSLVHLKFIATEDLTSATLTKISLTGADITTPSSYSFTDGVTLSAESTSNLLEISPQKSMNGTDAEFYLIVNEKTDATTDVTLSVEYTVGNQTFTAQKSGFANNVFHGGKKQSCSITIRNRTLVITGAEITPWEDSETLPDITIDSKEQES